MCCHLLLWILSSVHELLCLCSQQLSGCVVTTPALRIVGHNSQKSMLHNVTGYSIFGILDLIYYVLGLLNTFLVWCIVW